MQLTFRKQQIKMIIFVVLETSFHILRFFKQNVSRHVSSFISTFSSDYTGTGTGLIYGGCSRNFCISSLTENLMRPQVTAPIMASSDFFVKH